MADGDMRTTPSGSLLKRLRFCGFVALVLVTLLPILVIEVIVGRPLWRYEDA